MAASISIFLTLNPRNCSVEDFVEFGKALHFHNSLKKFHNRIRKRKENVEGESSKERKIMHTPILYLYVIY